MKAVVFHDVGDIRLEDGKEPVVNKPTDAIVRLTASAICGTDLHTVRGTLPGMSPGTILGHEGVGIVEQVGSGVRNLSPGDRVVIPSTSVAEIVPTAVPATTPSATTQIPTDQPQEQHSLVARKILARSTDCRRKKRAFRSRTLDW